MIILIPVVFEPARFDIVNRNMINFFRFFRKVGKGFVEVKIPEYSGAISVVTNGTSPNNSRMSPTIAFRAMRKVTAAS